MNFKHRLEWAVTSLLNRSATVLLIFNFYLLKTAMKSYSESHAITQHQRHHQYIKHYIQENRRVTAQNVLMTYAKLLLSDSSSSSPVPSSWNNHKLTPSVNSGTPVWGLHGDLNIPCSSAAPVQNAECSMIPFHKKSSLSLLSLEPHALTCRSPDLLLDDFVYHKCMLFLIGLSLHFTISSDEQSQLNDSWTHHEVLICIFALVDFNK